MRFLLAIVCVVLSALIGHAQEHVDGRITDKSGKSLASVNVTLSERDRILSFYITGADGRYALIIPQEKDSLFLTVSKLGYSSKKLLIYSNTKTLDLTLEEGEIELDEIIIKPPPVRKFGDTLSYRISEFTSGSDRTIGDVIKRLPGIEVDPSGKISYQGRPINRYYIDNLNLLDGRYGLVNDNLSHYQVTGVEIFENHQPVRILDSLEFSESAAINLKLKNRVTKTAVAHYGVGGKPFVWDINLTPMVFIPKLQFLGSFQSNNVGKNIGNQLRDFFSGEMLASNSHWLSIPMLQIPSFSESKWLDNISNLGSVNVLKRVKRDLEVKLNASLFLDNQSQHGASKMSYYLTDGYFYYSEKIQNRFAKNRLVSSIDFLKNTSKNYFKNKLSVENNWNDDEGLNNRISSFYEQRNHSRDIKVTNNFHKIFNINSITYHLFSLSEYKNVSQDLSVNFVGVDTSAGPTQTLQIGEFNTHNFFEFFKKIGARNKVIFKAGSEVSLNTVESGLSGYFSDNSSNLFKWKSFKNYASVGLNFEPGNWLFSFTTPLSYNLINYDNRIENQIQKFRRVVAEPKLHIRLKNNTRTVWNAGINYHNRLTRLGDIYNGFVMTNYLNVLQKKAGFRDNHLLVGSLGFEYSQAVSMFTFNMNYNYSYRLSNLLPENIIHTDGSRTVTYSENPNTAIAHTVSTRMSKYIFPLKSRFSLSNSYSQNNTERKINNVLGHLTQNSYSSSASINMDKIKWLEVYYEARYTYLLNSSTNVNQVNQVFSLGLLGVKNTLLRFSGEQYNLSRENSRQKYLFGDILVRYTFPKIRQDIEISLTNIFNRNTFTHIRVSDYFMQETSITLRPRQILLKGRINI